MGNSSSSGGIDRDKEIILGFIDRDKNVFTIVMRSSANGLTGIFYDDGTVDLLHRSYSSPIRFVKFDRLYKWKLLDNSTLLIDCKDNDDDHIYDADDTFTMGVMKAVAERILLDA